MLHGGFCVDTGDTRRDRALSPEEVDEGEHEAAPHGTPGPPWRCHRWVVDVDPASVTGPPLHLPPEEAAASRPAQGDRVLLTVDRREDGAARRITIDLRVLGG